MKKVNLSIKLQRLPKGVISKYRDVLLNGIEIFKISDSNSNLAGPNPEPRTLSPLPQTIQTISHSIKSNSIPVVIVVVAVSCLVLLLASIICIIIIFRRRSTEETSRERETTEGSSLPSHLCRYFTITELKAATNNFDDVSIVGIGGFGNVYKGYIHGTTPVAIKRLKPGSQQGVKEFLNEIEMLSQLRHIHLVSLIGYCNDGSEMILVYDFMQRGTLREHIYGSDSALNMEAEGRDRIGCGKRVTLSSCRDEAEYHSPGREEHEQPVG
ncbi:hypothetical protein RJT34_18405 [Clitoria ternatea]|uniref:Protein kinase domain-containing protein n=1 Tax=Clitoria ternatea TaxID=43366 RepID=A0AAN9JC18_CLITE